MLNIAGHPVEDWPSKVEKTFACFEKKLEDTLCKEIGPEYFESCLTECRNGFCIPKRKHAIKNPAVIADIIKKSHQDGRTSTTLSKIIENIIALKPC